MKIPGFNAEASLYKTSECYRVSASGFGGLPSSESILPTYYPSATTQANCNQCKENCIKSFGVCLGVGATTCGISCAFSGPAYPACLAACMGAALGACDLEVLGCQGLCMAPGPWTECCPQVCDFPAFDGEGCCDEGENCVDINDPNSRHGCCPSDQSVCGGKCCAEGDRCGGNECCPANFHCIDGFCTEFPPAPFGPSEPPPKPPKQSPSPFDCAPGWTHCKDKCCPPGLHCCIHVGGATSCQADCLMLK